MHFSLRLWRRPFCLLRLSNKLVASLWLLLYAAQLSASAQQTEPMALRWRANFIALEQAFGAAFDANQLTPLHRFYLPGKGIPGSLQLTSKPAQGMGSIAFNPAQLNAVFVQVPHRFFDKATATIARHWFASGGVKLLMTNSLHRHQGRKSQPAYNSDYSTATSSPLLAATRSFMRSYDSPLIIQLHGFSRHKRSSKAAQQAAVILSHGADLPAHFLHALNQAAACIHRQLGANALVFPQQVSELGGTQNVIGKQLQKLGYMQRFYHVELSAALRTKLSKNRDLSLGLLHCLEN